jgi:hypothetical protein
MSDQQPPYGSSVPPSPPGWPPPPQAPPPAPGPYAPPGPYGYTPVPPPRTNNNALVALIVGVVSLAICQPVGLVAFFVGRNARKEIAASNGQEGGDGLAVAGQIVGMVAFGLFVLSMLFVLVIVVISIIAAATTNDPGPLTSF